MPAKVAPDNFKPLKLELFISPLLRQMNIRFGDCRIAACSNCMEQLPKKRGPQVPATGIAGLEAPLPGLCCKIIMGDCSP